MSNSPRNGNEQASEEQQRFVWQHRRGALVAGLAIVAVAVLASSMLLVPKGQNATDHTDPTDAASVIQSRAESSIRPVLRQPLPLDRAVVPNPSTASSSEVTQLGDPSTVPDSSRTPGTRAKSTKTPGEAPLEPTPSSEVLPVTKQPEQPTTSVSPTQSPSPDLIPSSGADAGTRWTTESVSVRNGPGTDFNVVAMLGIDDEVTITNVLVDGQWQQVRLGNVTGFVPLKFLTDQAPLQDGSASMVPTESASGDPGYKSGEICPAAASVEDGLSASAVEVLHSVCQQFPSIEQYDGSGEAFDIVVFGEPGWEIARWLQINAEALGVSKVIYSQKVWTAERADEGWRELASGDSDGANYLDRVHVVVG